MSVQGKHCPENQNGEACVTYTYQSATVAVPIFVKPKVKAGEINTICCGEPTIIQYPCKVVCDSKAGGCSYILKQNICIEVPIEISTDACVGCPLIECLEVSEGFCDDCEG